MTGLPLLGDAELAAALRSEVEESWLAHARTVAFVGELQQRGVEARAGYASLAEFLKQVLRIDTREAKRLLAQASALCPSVSPTGTPVEPTLPLVAEAAAEGVLSPSHLDVLVGAMEDLPAKFEQELVDIARKVDPAGVRVVANRIRAYVDQDGKEPDESELVKPQNTLRWRKKRDGRVEFGGTLGVEEGAKFEALISPLSKPRPADATGPDERDILERQGDALVDLLDLASRSEHLPSEAGERPHLFLTLPWEALQSGLGKATLGDGTPFSIPEARRLACTAGIIPAILNTDGAILELGRMTRKISPNLRRVLRQRDGGCAFPGCHRPPTWCDAHHVIAWQDGGPADLDNLVLLCGHHHRMIHHTDWQVRMINGIPWFIPPALIDPERKPLRNPLRTHTAA
jgi:hypothetical protein